MKIANKEVFYRLKKRRGTKNVKLSIYPSGLLLATAPKWYPIYLIERFIQMKAGWILENTFGTNFILKEQQEKEDYKKNKEEARRIIEGKLFFFNQYYNFSYQRCSVRNQKTCWGSCSGKKNLNFNYKIIKLPTELQDYVIVHELCHLKELNHSQNFWKEVAKTIPDFKERRKKLRKIKF